ncbi:MAG: sulfurtransferase [Halanaerobium sp.]
MKDHHKRNFIFIILITLLIITAFNAAAAEEFENPELLISAEELNQKLEAEEDNLKIIDVRNSAKYLLGHIPGSVNMWGNDFSNPEGWIDGLIAEPKAFSDIAQEKGINNDSEIVVYDDSDSIWAARLWWIFRVYDHQDIKVLEGGFDAWKEKDFETKMLPFNPEKGDFEVEDVNNDWIVNTDTIAENLEDDDFIVLDTRTEAEYLGEETNSGAPRRGRIPNSVHIEWNQVLDEDNNFKSASEIEEIYESKGINKNKEVIAPLCHTGVRAAHTFFTLKLLGYDNIKLYDESWVGWSSRSDLPVEKN